MGDYKKPEQNEVLQYLLSQDADVVCLQEVEVFKSDRYLTLPEVREKLGRKYRYSYIDFSRYDSWHHHQFQEFGQGQLGEEVNCRPVAWICVTQIAGLFRPAEKQFRNPNLRPNCGYLGPCNLWAACP